MATDKKDKKRITDGPPLKKLLLSLERRDALARGGLVNFTLADYPHGSKPALVVDATITCLKHVERRHDFETVLWLFEARVTRVHVSRFYEAYQASDMEEFSTTAQKVHGCFNPHHPRGGWIAKGPLPSDIEF